jgi:hypothetical protein
VHNAVDAPLPITHLDGKIDTTALNASFRTRFGSNLRFNARYRYYDNDNKTPRTEFPGHVRFDAVWEDIGRITVPFGYSDEFCVGEINHLGANLKWQCNDSWAIGGGAFWEKYEFADAQTQQLLNYMPGSFFLVADNWGYDSWAGWLNLTFTVQ